MIYLRKANDVVMQIIAGWTPGILSLLPTIRSELYGLLRAARD